MKMKQLIITNKNYSIGMYICVKILKNKNWCVTRPMNVEEKYQK